MSGPLPPFSPTDALGKLVATVSAERRDGRPMPDVYAKAFGRAVSYYRVKAGVGVREFAAIVGISAVELGEIERGVLTSGRGET